MCMLHPFFSIFSECQAPPIGLEYELQRFRSFSLEPYGRKYSWNDAEEDGGKKRFCPWWRPLISRRTRCSVGCPSLLRSSSGLFNAWLLWHSRLLLWSPRLAAMLDGHCSAFLVGSSGVQRGSSWASAVASPGPVAGTGSLDLLRHPGCVHGASRRKFAPGRRVGSYMFVPLC